MLHFPVLLEESVDFLITNLDGNYIDCTFGRGGHTSKILRKISPEAKLTSFDKDAEAYEFAKSNVVAILFFSLKSMIALAISLPCFSSP